MLASKAREPIIDGGDAIDGTLHADLLVLGAGMGGHTAAGYAAQHGAKVVLLEKAPETGGNAVLSGTSLWTAPTLEILHEHAPDGDAELGRHLVETYPEAVAWVRSTGVQLSPPRWVLGYGKGYRFDIVSYFARCQALVKDRGGWMLTGTRVDELITTDGRVSGARVRGPDGYTEITADATVLATGGFQGNREMLREAFGENGDKLLLRSNPHSTGDGIALAKAAGAAIVGDMRHFYGHLMMSPIPNFAREHYTRLGTWFSEVGILLNTMGERFTDETGGDHMNAQAAARQPEAKALLILDDFLVQNMQLNDAKITTALDEGRRSNVRIATADTLDELGSAVTAWGFDGARAVRSVREFNAQLERGTPLPVPRKRLRYPLADAPFRALELRSAITFTQAGVRVDREARALDLAGAPIAGLYVAGADMGGVYNGGYAGGLALACVFGLTAARAHLLAHPVGAAR